MSGDFGNRNKNQQGKAQQKKKCTAQVENIATKSLNYDDAICEGCGEPGHVKAACSKNDCCFICKASNHPVEECLVLKRPHQIARYIGSSATGLRFYHIEAPEISVNPISSIRNCGVVTIEDGEISREDLAREFSNIYKTNWPWKIRELGDWSYLVKFPPHIPVEQVIGYPMFGLAKEGLNVSVTKWLDDPETVETLVETWIQIRGLVPPWSEWNIIDQAVSVCGMLKKVDWQSVFRNCAEVVRVEIFCRDPTKIPAGSLFIFYGKLFQLQFTAKMASGSGTQRDATNAGKEGGNAGGGIGAGSNDMDTDGRSGTNRNTANSQSSEGSNQQTELGAGTHGRLPLDLM
jgi:hypothetical protein